jgi:ABC-type transport system involved in cytochrome c biogenesis ATPase subunit
MHMSSISGGEPQLIKPPPPALTMFTFDDLLTEINLMHRAATSRKPGWERLRKVTESLASGQHAHPGMIEGRRWSLLRVKVQGFRGIGSGVPLAIEFDPNPGITVIHGANGSGKSSVADAIHSALYRPAGIFRTRDRGSAGKEAVWEPYHVRMGSTSATAELVLGDGADRLHLRCEIAPDGSTLSSSAFLEREGLSHTIALGSEWHDALNSHEPVYAYATVERQIQQSRDLAEYFERLLALGGCFLAMANEVERQSAEATNALAQFTGAERAAWHELAAIDKARRLNVASDLDDVPMPTVTDEIDSWLIEHQLANSTEVAVELNSDQFDQLLSHSMRVLELSDQLTRARTAPHGHLVTALKRLREAVDRVDSPGMACPVCGSEVSWRDTLQETLERLSEIDDLEQQLASVVQLFETAVQGDLSPVFRMRLESATGTELHGALSEGARLTEALAVAAARVDVDSRFAKAKAAQDLAGWIATDHARILFQGAIDQSSHLRQWHAARSRVLAPFIGVWRQVRDAASDAPQWKETGKLVGELQARLRERRTDAFRTRAGVEVKHLLEDVGLSLGVLNVTGTRVTMTLIDQSGVQLKLGMLSAGQRNAVLLAPLLASIEAGPFGFLVLDDPVHAFDEMRVDRLARTVAKLAEDRRVVVFTHDERLREHLLAKSLDCDSWSVTRAGETGTVAISPDPGMPAILIRDAQAMFDDGRAIPGTLLSLTDTVRGLCRQAVDNELRRFVLRNAQKQGRNVDVDLRRLDSAKQLDDRFQIALEVTDGHHHSHSAVKTARQQLNPHLNSWNAAVHGSRAESEVHDSEIRAARRICARLGDALA